METVLQVLVSLANAVAAIAINALWQDALLVGGVWLVLRGWPNLNAATRYTVWTATLVAAVVIPVATTLAFVSPSAAPVAQAVATRTHATQSVASSPARTTALPASQRGAAKQTPNAALSLPQRFRLALPLPVSVAIFLAWAALAAFSLVRLAIGLARLEQLKRDALPLPVEYREAMERWTQVSKGAREVRLCVTDDIDVPVAVGLFDSMILIPRSLLERLSESEVDQISLHELAHLRRADDWSNGLQRIVIALLAWNPAAQFIAQQLDLEREVACDDWVLSVIGAVRPYALCLTKMAETASWPHRPLAAPGVFVTRKHISLRIERLLGAGRNVATNLALGPTAAAMAVVAALTLVIAFVAPSIAAPAVSTATVAQPAVAVSPAARVKVSKPQPKPKEIVRYVRVAVAGTPSPMPSPTPAAVVVPPIHVHVPARTINVPATDVDVPKMTISIPSIHWGQSGRGCMGCDYKDVDWSGRDLHGQNYSGVDFKGARLIGTNFSGGSFMGVNFLRADLRNANFANAHLTGVDFRGARLDGANFTGADLTGCNFRGVDLTHVDLSHAQMTDTDLSRHNPRR